MAPIRTLSILIGSFFLMAVPLYGLTVEEVLRLKQAGVGEETIRMLIQEESSKTLGVREVERPDGGKDKIYYSITSPEEESGEAKEEEEKIEKSWDMLRNIVIER
jgi:hypothetical protein